MLGELEQRGNWGFIECWTLQKKTKKLTVLRSAAKSMLLWSEQRWAKSLNAGATAVSQLVRIGWCTMMLHGSHRRFRSGATCSIGPIIIVPTQKLSHCIRWMIAFHGGRTCWQENCHNETTLNKRNLNADIFIYECVVEQLHNKYPKRREPFMLVSLVVHLCERGSAFWEGSARTSGGCGVVGLTLSPSVPLTSSGFGGDCRSPGADSCSGTAAANTAALRPLQQQSAAKSWEFKQVLSAGSQTDGCSCDLQAGCEVPEVASRSFSQLG